MSTNWYYSDGSQTYGPVAVEQFIAMIRSGQIGGTNLILQEGLGEWQILSASPFAVHVPQNIPRARIQISLADIDYEEELPPAKSFPVKKFVIGVVALIVSSSIYFLHSRSRETIERIEGEVMKVVKVTGGKAQAQGTAQFRAAVWSKGGQLRWTGAAKNDTMKLSLPVGESGRQRLKAVFSISPNDGMVDVTLDGRAVEGTPFNLQHWAVSVSDILDWGVHDLSKGDHELTLKFTGTAAANGKFEAGLDYVQMEPPERISTLAATGTNVALAARPSASFRKDGANPVTAINDGKVFTRSNLVGSTVPRHTWHRRLGGMEWAQLEWETPQLIKECGVFWFVDLDLPRGECALPFFWRILYREESGAWLPVDSVTPAAEKDKWSTVKFSTVKTRALRIAVQCAVGQSAGVVEWKAIAADPAASPAATRTPRPDLFLGDLTPLHAVTGVLGYAANQYHTTSIREGKVMRVGGKECDRYLLTHAPSRVEFAIPQGYTHFRATGFGPTDTASQEPFPTRWKYQVRVDGKSVFESKDLRSYPNHELPMDIALPPGAKSLTLIVDQLGDNRWDHSCWGHAILTAGSGNVSGPENISSVRK